MKILLRKNLDVSNCVRWSCLLQYHSLSESMSTHLHRGIRSNMLQHSFTMVTVSPLLQICNIPACPAGSSGS